MKIKTRRRIRRTFESGLLFIVTVFFVYPMYWMVKSAFTSDSELYFHPFALLPSRPTLDHFATLLQNQYLGTYFENSIIVAVGSTAVVIVVASLGGYSLVRMKYPGRDLISSSFLFTQMVPSVLIIIPFYVIMSRLGIINSLLSLIVAYMTFSLPIAIWLMKSYFATIPVEIEESALVDGCSRLGVIFRVVIPLSAPGIVATAIFSFLGAWGDLIFAYTLVNKQSLLTVPAGLAQYVSGTYSDYGGLLAFSFLASIPPLLLFAFVLKYYVAGLTAGAGKG
jgi:multiple sugar transport system permease protein